MYLSIWWMESFDRPPFRNEYQFKKERTLLRCDSTEPGTKFRQRLYSEKLFSSSTNGWRGGFRVFNFPWNSRNIFTQFLKAYAAPEPGKRENRVTRCPQIFRVASSISFMPSLRSFFKSRASIARRRYLLSFEQKSSLILSSAYAIRTLHAP